MATSVRHIQRLVDERRIPYLKVGRFVRFDPVDLSVWLDEHRVEVYIPVSRRRLGASSVTSSEPGDRGLPAGAEAPTGIRLTRARSRGRPSDSEAYQ